MEAVQYLKNPSVQVQLESVGKNGLMIRFIKNPNEQVQLESVRQNGWAIEYIENPSEQAQLESVRQYGYAIAYIKNPNEQVQLESVRKDGYAIRYINNPSERVQLEALKQNLRYAVYYCSPEIYDVWYKSHLQMLYGILRKFEEFEILPNDMIMDIATYYTSSHKIKEKYVKK